MVMTESLRQWLSVYTQQNSLHELAQLLFRIANLTSHLTILSARHHPSRAIIAPAKDIGYKLSIQTIDYNTLKPLE